MKRTKRLIILLTLMFILTALSMLSAHGVTIVQSGSCGTNKERQDRARCSLLLCVCFGGSDLRFQSRGVAKDASCLAREQLAVAVEIAAGERFGVERFQLRGDA